MSDGMSSKAKKKARLQLAQESGWVCFYCDAPLIPDDEQEKYTKEVIGGITPIDGYSFPELDHKKPLSRGGKSTIENLVLSCGKCNHTKNKKNQDEYSEWLKK